MTIKINKLNKIKKIIIGIIVTMFFTYNNVYAQFRIPNPSLCNDMACLLARLGAFIRPLAAISFLLMFTYGGFLYMTGADDEDQIAKAKSIMTGAVIGIILVFTAPALTDFVLSLFQTTFIR